MPKTEDITKALNLLLKYSNQIQTKSLNCIPICSIENACDITSLINAGIISKCDGGKIWCSISPSGDLFFCPSVRKSLGNILDTNSLDTIWKNHPLFIRINDDSCLRTRCLNCDKLSMCGGGCKAFSKIIDDHIEINDPMIRGDINANCKL